MLSATLIVFHDAFILASKRKEQPLLPPEGIFWEFVQANHHFNLSLWDEEDQARRKDVSDSEIAANKRAIDGYNQKRNDAIERLDEILLSGLESVTQRDHCRLNSETAGSMIDRLSILALKIYHMKLQTERNDATQHHIETCKSKLARLIEQRSDLGGCLDNLLEGCRAGREKFKVYRQFKMYNDPTMNPYLYGKNKA